MALAPEPFLTRDLLAIAQPRPASIGCSEGYCPFHAGSTAHDLVIDELRGRFRCIVCNVTGWAESSYQPPQKRIDGAGVT